MANDFQMTATPAGCPKSASEQWFREDCSVRWACRRKHFRVEVRHDPGYAAWLDLDQLMGLRSAWPEAARMSPIELATAPQFHPHSRMRGFQRSPGGWLYRTLKPGAHGVKVLLQMLVGVGAVLDIGVQVNRFVDVHASLVPTALSTAAVVHVIAYALAVAAAVELAYTLFTPGPDEALDPLMLGLSSGILLLITTDTSQTLSATVKFSGILLGVLALGALFLIRHHLVGDDEQ